MSENNYKLTHQPCIDPDCGSSDALSVFKNGSAKCFSCEKIWNPAQYQRATKDQDYVPIGKSSPSPNPVSVKATGGEIRAIESRCITLATVKKYNVRVVVDEDGMGSIWSRHGRRNRP